MKILKHNHFEFKEGMIVEFYDNLTGNLNEDIFLTLMTEAIGSEQLHCSVGCSDKERRIWGTISNNETLYILYSLVDLDDNTYKLLKDQLKSLKVKQ